MVTKKIRFGLSVKKISKAIKELEDYKRELIRKAALLRVKIAEQIASEAHSRFTGAVVDDLLKGQRLAQVEVTVTESHDISIVIANGEDAIWVEFGAGVYHNGTAGSSPHPLGSAHGFTIGEYGYGMGKKKVWGFYKDGELVLTHGTPAIMPMYNAVKIVSETISEIAREVFA